MQEKYTWAELDGKFHSWKKFIVLQMKMKM